MTSLKGLLTLALSLGLTTAGIAAPSFLGLTGLIFTPTADTLQKNAFNASIHAVEGDSPLYSFNVGFKPNLEGGFSQLPDSETIINAKYTFLPESAKTIGVAAGVMDLTDQKATTLYVVASKKYSTKDLLYGVDYIQGSLGIAGGDSDEFVLDGVFGGVGIGIAKRATVMLEYDGDNFNYGARYDLGKGFDARIGVAGEGHDLLAGISYTGKL
ncbi:MAG TPA: hypothetical protein VHV83_03985 [Armatimonadota bacterium]|nr:hypothetical protein [Armatimonadota bacterium]